MCIRDRYAPGAAAAQMVESIAKNEKRIFPCCVHLNGQYGLDNVFVGVPVKLGRNGIENIIELKLTESEQVLLNQSADEVRSMMEVYDKLPG